MRVIEVERLQACAVKDNKKCSSNNNYYRQAPLGLQSTQAKLFITSKREACASKNMPVLVTSSLNLLISFQIFYRHAPRRTICSKLSLKIVTTPEAAWQHVFRCFAFYKYTWWSKKPHKVNNSIILQPYVTESCGFQQNVPKEISYVTKVNI